MDSHARCGFYHFVFAFVCGRLRGQGSEDIMAGKKKRWVARVQSTSDAMDLERGGFKKRSAKGIAKSGLGSVKTSKRRKGTVLQSGIPMMTYVVNRGGAKLPAKPKRTIRAAKEEYRRLAGKKKGA